MILLLIIVAVAVWCCWYRLLSVDEVVVNLSMLELEGTRLATASKPTYPERVRSKDYVGAIYSRIHFASEVD